MSARPPDETPPEARVAAGLAAARRLRLARKLKQLQNGADPTDPEHPTDATDRTARRPEAQAR